MELDRRKAVVLGCVVAALAVAGGCRHEETGSAGPEHPTVGVSQPAQRPIVEYAYFTGRLQAVDSVQVRARVTGYLQKVCYTPGTQVAKDTVLFEIDPLQYQAQVDMAKGKLGEARSQVLEAKAKVGQAEAQVALDRSKLAIDQEVAKTAGAISRLKLEEDEAKLKESEATLEAAKASVLALEASVKAAEANLEYNELNLAWTKVKAPIAGRVDRNLLTEGNLVTADVTTLTNIDAAGQVYAYFDVDELKFLEVREKIRQGAYAEPDRVPIGVALQNDEGFPHVGKVDVIANALKTSTGTIQVRAILQNEKRLLTPGNFVQVRLPLDKARDKLLVPDRAVIFEQGDTFLLVVNSENKVDKRKVVIGPLDPNDKAWRVIEEGLKAGEWVVVQDRQRVRPGVTVETKRL
jgi:RND family efflux transporter MFP subunit